MTLKSARYNAIDPELKRQTKARQNARAAQGRTRRSALNEAILGSWELEKALAEYSNR